ncbi:Ubiquitin [Pandoravirus salinus]|uniref:Ubiquitin n=1 Tax=Pandoravirus salinus TaxID=1349410 RepID=S4W2T1_9VIRU|nr:Ubiquitin [Pandoravirus salinus]AGO84862.1 Ubiquitin [Pandoravirus salinus]
MGDRKLRFAAWPCKSAHGVDDEWTVDVSNAAGGGDWVDAPLPECCVCVNRKAGCVLLCRCTAPCVCVWCAGRLDACPQCHTPFQSIGVPRASLGYQGNIGALRAPRAWETARLFVQTLAGKTLTLCLRLNSTVCHLKEAVQDREGIPPDQQRALFAGTEMDDRLMLTFYRMHDDCAVHLVCRVHGD